MIEASNLTMAPPPERDRPRPPNRRHRSLRLHELTPQRASLEEAFIELTRGEFEYAEVAQPELLGAVV